MWIQVIFSCRLLFMRRDVSKPECRYHRLGKNICQAGPFDFRFSAAMRAEAASAACSHACTEAANPLCIIAFDPRSEEHTSELQSLMRISYAVFCLNTKKKN